MSAETIPDVVHLLSDLVAIDTAHPAGNEGKAAALLAEIMSRHGFEVEVEEIEPGRSNLLARVEFGAAGPAKPTVMLNSHLDVVPAGPGWSVTPFTAVEKGGRLYGRGAADAKASLASMAVAAMGLCRPDEAGELSGTLVYTAVIDEEAGSAGVQRLLDQHRADGAIVGEPTGGHLFTAHQGSVCPVVEVTARTAPTAQTARTARTAPAGRSAHARASNSGANAIVHAAALIELIGDYDRVLAGRGHMLVGAPTVTPVLVEGGEAYGSVPERCRLTLDRRLVPGETEKDALMEIEQLLAQFNTDYAPVTARVVDYAPTTGGPSETPTGHPFVVSCQRGLAEAGLAVQVGGLGVGCDMTHFRAAGIPCVVTGPGAVEAMHIVDEYVDLDEVRRSVRTYDALVRELLRPGATWWR
ncbi:MAG: M20 family metallopeptidase [Actinopolymorphaceae bacterium]